MICFITKIATVTCIKLLITIIVDIAIKTQIEIDTASKDKAEFELESP